MGSCTSVPSETDAVELLPEPLDIAVLWDFINPLKKRQKYGRLCTHGHPWWCISFDGDVFTIYDREKDVSAKATITDLTGDGFTLSATFDYVVRQSVYVTPSITKPRTLSFAFSLKDNIDHNVQTYGWRTKVGMYEKGHFIQYYGLV